MRFKPTTSFGRKMTAELVKSGLLHQVDDAFETENTIAEDKVVTLVNNQHGIVI